jgi:hypothetical protein
MTPVQSLREERLVALENYTRQAQKTCELLGEVEEPAQALDRLLAIAAETQAEDSEQQVYLGLRQRLFDMLYEVCLT